MAQLTPFARARKLRWRQAAFIVAVAAVTALRPASGRGQATPTAELGDYRTSADGDPLAARPAAAYLPRRVVMRENWPLIWLHVVSDGIIAVAYFTIPVALVYFVRRRRDLAFNWILVCFAVFILACGATHALAVLAIWRPMYRVEGAVKLITAVSSVGTAAVLWMLIPKALALPSPAQAHATNEAFRSLLENAREYGMYSLDVHENVKTWESGAERVLGYRADEVTGGPFSRFYPPDEIASGTPGATLKAAALTGRSERDCWKVRRDGTRFWATVVTVPIRDAEGGLVGFVKIVRDLTEHIQAEELRSFFALSPDGLCIAGQDGYFKRLNPAWRRMLGYTDEELRAQPYIEFVHPDDRAATAAQAAKLADGAAVVYFENRYRSKDGFYRWLMWKATVSADRQQIYAAATDVTARRRADEEIAELNDKLRRHNAQLEAANHELEAFSYSVSHDLRSPLRAIDGFSQALLEDHHKGLGEEARDHLRRIRAASQRMGRLIDDLLNLSKVTRVQMTRQQTDLSRIAREVAAELRESEPARDVEFRIADGLTANADPNLLRIVLNNLLGNAWKFTAKREKAEIEFGAAASDGALAYVVRDNGAGFDNAYAGKLFGAFQRLHSESEFAGTGIGLATIQRIVHRHGGRVWAEGRIGAGATFGFTL